ncbi:hypothetical protein VF21_03829 [Pseudogymnoascus sp. 05NY08]|nr:hypothetical protein VF21_03829 [Pseudogymnoascus sp. 05NY08]
MANQDNDDQTPPPEEEVLGYFESVEYAVFKCVQHVPTTLDGFLQLDVILHEGAKHSKRRHAQFLETFRRTFGIPTGASITSVARDLYGEGSNPIQWIRAVVCTLFDEFEGDSRVLFDDPTQLKRGMAKHMNSTLVESILVDFQVETWAELPPIFVRRRNALVRCAVERLRAVMSSTGDSTEAQLEGERHIIDIAAKLHVVTLASRGSLATIRPEIGDPFNEKYHTKDNPSQSGTVDRSDHDTGHQAPGTSPVSSDELDSDDDASSTVQSIENNTLATCLRVGEKAGEIIQAMDDEIIQAMNDEITPAVDDGIIPAVDDEITEGGQIQDESDSNISANSTANTPRGSTTNHTPQVPAALTTDPKIKEVTWASPIATAAKQSRNKTTRALVTATVESNGSETAPVVVAATAAERNRNGNTPELETTDNEKGGTALRRSGRNQPTKRKINDEALLIKRSRQKQVDLIRRKPLYEIPPESQGLPYLNIVSLKDVHPCWDLLEKLRPENG